MSVVISSALAATEAFQANSNTPLIGYQNLVTTSNITATTAATGSPATNLANPSTLLTWTGANLSPLATEYLTANVQSVEGLDYVGIARHNLGTAQTIVSVEGVTDGGASPEVWTELVGETMLADDAPAIFRFTSQALAKVRLKLQPGTVAPSIAVMYTGKLLQIQRNIFVGHTPITYGRRTEFATSRTESGNFGGRIVLSEWTETKLSLSLLTSAWYRANFDAFVDAAKTDPFFFAWRPGDYPAEIGYCWTTDDPIPQNDDATGMMSVGLSMRGIRE